MKDNYGVLSDLKLVSVVVVVVVVATIFSISKNDRVFTNLRYYTVVSAASLERCTFVAEVVGYGGVQSNGAKVKLSYPNRIHV